MAGSKKSDAIIVAFHPGPSLGHELGIMFGFIALFVLATVVYYVMWQGQFFASTDGFVIHLLLDLISHVFVRFVPVFISSSSLPLPSLFSLLPPLIFLLFFPSFSMPSPLESST